MAGSSIDNQCGRIRKVLCLNLSVHPDFDCEDELAKIGWQSVYVSSLEQAREAIASHKISVAIVAICSDSQQRVFNGLTALIRQHKNLIWIALSCDNSFSEYGQVKRNPMLFFDYHHYPVDWDKLAHTLGHAYGMARLRNKAYARTEKQSSPKAVMSGRSAAMQKLKKLLEKVASVDATVLINGETGCGKGLCAQWIHENSARADGPFVIVNSAALPSNLIHSELFGFEKGAFTGAAKRHIGYLERADKGTLFLDEIGDLSLESQVNLLRFLEDNTIERLGSGSRITVDCRIVFATHVDIEQAVDRGQFREDLYHRINILPVQVPALRERRQDIELLANDFLSLYQKQGPDITFSDQAIEAMLSYSWPGNVRELKNRIQRAVVLCENSMISAADLGIRYSQNRNPEKRSSNKVHLETEALLAAIQRNNNNISAAARELQISRTTLYKLVRKCNIKI
ncbi:sigma-54-dependent transcriptional regulator [Vibrio sp. SCSIO 43137]|uniref:sigma-54-dependent transcriptional regulator n=1 Tax=Vibrio sp. SCSIO 43137 TaxID=3021011 RepID=UPI0023073D18|nr:sigma-54 dependent transcriptional regulator [Vibrio sp. SCSIO 43137]WCE30786.1 sigma-54 dependent transcriptional regulator [Vibrio sp. SCSIO 43137]